jgi:hypothetical protein
MTQANPSSWPLLHIPVGTYLGYAIALRHHQNHQYKVNITRPPCVYNWGWTDIISDHSFSLEKQQEAIAHAHELIDSEVDSILPY